MINLKLLEKLCKTPGISGDENLVRDTIVSEIKGFADKIEIDSLGNIIVFKNGNKSAKSKLMITAHMDEVGSIVTGVTPDGLLKFDTVGGIDEKVLLGKGVTVGNTNVPGVIGVKPIHVSSSDEKRSAIKVENMYIDIGANNKDDALSYVSLGDYICFDSEFHVDNDIVKAKALDDRVGCLILIDLIKQSLPFDIYFTFVVQEEVGLRGSTVAAYNIDPDKAIVVEATTAADIYGNHEENKVCNLHSGAVVSFMDKATVYNREYYNLAFELSEKYNIKVQPKRAVAGGNDAGAIHKSRGGVKTVTVSVPCRYLHSPYCMVSYNDIIETENIVLKLAECLAAHTD